MAQNPVPAPAAQPPQQPPTLPAQPVNSAATGNAPAQGGMANVSTQPNVQSAMPPTETPLIPKTSVIVPQADPPKTPITATHPSPSTASVVSSSASRPLPGSLASAPTSSISQPVSGAKEDRAEKSDKPVISAGVVPTMPPATPAPTPVPTPAKDPSKVLPYTPQSLRANPAANSTSAAAPVHSSVPKPPSDFKTQVAVPVASKQSTLPASTAPLNSPVNIPSNAQSALNRPVTQVSNVNPISLTPQASQQSQLAPRPQQQPLQPKQPAQQASRPAQSQPIQNSQTQNPQTRPPQNVPQAQSARPPVSAGLPPSGPKPPVPVATPNTQRPNASTFATGSQQKSGMPPVQPNGPAAPKPPSASMPPASPKQPLPPQPARPIPGSLAGAPPPLSPKPPAPPTPAGSPKPAEIRQSPFRFIPFVIGGLLLLLIAYFIFTRFFGGSKQNADNSDVTGNAGTANNGKSVTLTYWGLWETTPVMQDVIADYQQSHPGVKINYQQQSYRDYRERLQTAVVGGRGPDIFRFHASWVPMLKQELSSMPSSVYSPAEFEQTFYPVASEQLTLGNQIVGVPLMYDGLALYYNEEMLKTANVQPPTTWADVKKVAMQLTIRNGSQIQRGGIALGNATNVEHFSDILGLLMIQNGADLSDPTSSAAQEALTFYTNFVKTDHVWDGTLPSSTVAFARGDVAMMIAPSWRVHDIQSLNPNLKFSIAPVPQLSNAKATWGTYWAEGVSAQSKNKTEAWEFLKYLSSAEVLKKFQSSASKSRSFGELYPRRDMANDMGNPQFTSAYLQDAPIAKNWYLNSYTHDNGLNDLLIKYYEDAITATVQGGDPANVLKTVSQGTTQILRQYGLSGAAQQQTTAQ